MSDWTAGYMTDIDYVYSYNTELNPLRARFAFLAAGLCPPQVGTACELGFGQGLSATIHAAASNVPWAGTDFNPAQAGFAESLVAASGADARLYDDTFADFSERTDLPDFDYIGLHGIWSWVSDENRRVMVDFVRRKLKVGGVLYIGYNSLPGWAAFAPMRHLLNEHVEILGSKDGGVIGRVDGALDFASRLMATQPLYAVANPQVEGRVERLKGMNRQYLAHEYFDRDWHPMHFSTMAAWLSPAKLQYACSAHYLDHIDTINLSVEQQGFLDEIADPGFRQTVRDFMVNRQFRKDYWVKGARRIDSLEQAELIRALRFVLVTPRAEVGLAVSGNRGEVTMQEGFYGPILDSLAGHEIKSLAQIEQDVRDAGIGLPQVIQALMLLCGSGHVVPAQDEAQIDAARPRTDKLNRHLMLKARGNGEIGYLASPVSGGGVSVNRFQQLFLLAIEQNGRTPEDIARFVWPFLAAQGLNLLKDGRVLGTAEENLAELGAQAGEFMEKRLPILRALGIA